MHLTTESCRMVNLLSSDPKTKLVTSEACCKLTAICHHRKAALCQEIEPLLLDKSDYQGLCGTYNLVREVFALKIVSLKKRSKIHGKWPT